MEETNTILGQTHPGKILRILPQKNNCGVAPPDCICKLKTQSKYIYIYMYIYIYIYFSTINATVELTTFTSSDNKLEQHLVVRLIIVMSPWNSIKQIGVIPLFLLVYSTFLLNIPNRSHDFQIFMAFADWPLLRSQHSAPAPRQHLKSSHQALFGVVGHKHIQLFAKNAHAISYINTSRYIRIYIYIYSIYWDVVSNQQPTARKNVLNWAN